MPPELREKAILEAAIGLARESGIAVLTVRTIAAAAGVTPALVAHYRPGMDAFVAEVFGAIVAAEREEVMASSPAVVGARARIAAIVDTLLDGDRDDVTLVWVQAWAAGARNDELGARVRLEMDAWQAALEELVAGGVAAGEIAPAHAQGAAWLLLAMVDGMNAHSLVKWAPDDRAGLARRALAAVLG
ncbi:TetR/AcrR family transcriptional regulator [Microbacterium sp. ASV81]|uniref:TetR family transcriptional regulator C-terminal domain-containing protein n=1 Tax=Microbacterium capsulatum TaxID=3041921 RepID=A0ABU0XGH1_9MICO|nr:TetR family transcriptional regulator C-terminal domain-containing protein [Microbacterium sp. ASV81]MDQ4214161.1 TetR family transcriptional regulator C-terminal domain-containing protein [Microbacterium sp. ASV81]